MVRLSDLPIISMHRVKNYADSVTICSACLLLAISAAEVNTRSPSRGQPELQGLWDRTLSKANEVVQVVQNWNPDYFNAVDPMCSYIIFLAGSVLTMDHASGPYAESPSSRTSEHLDLLVLFLGQVGQYWPIGMLFLSIPNLELHF